MEYSKQLHQRKRQLRKEIDEFYKILLKDTSEENISKMNLLKLNLKTVESRIKNFGQRRLQEELHLPNTTEYE